MSRTPCVARPIVEMPDTRQRSTLPPFGDQHDLVVVDHLRDADRPSPFRSLVRIVMMPLPPRFWTR